MLLEHATCSNARRVAADLELHLDDDSLVLGNAKQQITRLESGLTVVSAEMPAGSVLAWLGGTLHGAGANVTDDDWRHGVFLSYSLGWLRQEENQYVDVPLELAKTLDPELRRLVGYAMHDGLGFYEPR